MAERSNVWRGVGSFAQNALDVGAKADVEHAVGFVEHDVDDVAQIKRSSFDVVENAAGRADHDVDAASQGANLALDRLAAEGTAHADCRPAASFWISPTICWVSSRVGARIDRLWPAPAGLEHFESGIPKAAVLPVPVLAWPITSSPSSTRGMKAA